MYERQNLTLRKNIISEIATLFFFFLLLKLSHSNMMES